MFVERVCQRAFIIFSTYTLCAVIFACRFVFIASGDRLVNGFCARIFPSESRENYSLSHFRRLRRDSLGAPPHNNGVDFAKGRCKIISIRINYIYIYMWICTARCVVVSNNLLFIFASRIIYKHLKRACVYAKTERERLLLQFVFISVFETSGYFECSPPPVLFR